MKSPEKITLYGNTWCPDSHRARLIFRKNKVEFTNIDIEENPDAAKIVMEINNGNCSVPTILFPDGTVMVEPSNRELRDKIAELVPSK